MSQPEAGRSKSSAPQPSLLDVIKVVLRLGPKQINDEIQLAIGQMKTKGVAAGIAVALMVVGLAFLTFLVVALIVAAVAAFALIFELWAAALIVAGIFLVIALIFALIGLFKFKKTMPLLPEDAIRGFRLDLGVAREGSHFDPQTLDRQDAERRRQKEEDKRREAEQAKKDAKTPGAGKPTPPTYSELLRRTAVRRDHLGELQDQITSGVRNISDSAREKSEKVRSSARRRPSAARASGAASRRDAGRPATSEPTIDVAPDSARTDRGSSSQAPGEFVAKRWKPLTVAVGSAAAGAVFLRELVKK